MQALRNAAALVLAAGAVLVAAAAAAGAPFLGVYGNTAYFDGLRGPGHPVRHVIAGWGHGQTYGAPLASLLAGLKPLPMLGVTSAIGWPARGAITPQAIAAGRGDAYLFALNKALNDYRGLAYVRPLAEMDSYKNPYCAFNANGTPRSSAHSTRNFRKAFARISILLHGGSREYVNARLRRLGLPGIAQDLPTNPTSRLRVVWNPLGFSEPKRPGNTPADYYPGDAYVDVVGGDVYKTRRTSAT